MIITISQIEAELQTELLTCSECHIRTRTLPAENVAAQALRYGILCGHVFYMELPRHRTVIGARLMRLIVKNSNSCPQQFLDF